MEQVYQRIIEFMKESGKRIKDRAGTIEDIGKTKQWLTEEDIAIERGFKEIIASLGKDHVLYAEEEHSEYMHADHLWVADPISSTRSFLKGLAHYAIVISYVEKGVPTFAAVYDPAMDELYTAFRGQGAFLNGRQLRMVETQDRPRLIMNISSVGWEQHPFVSELFKIAERYSAFRNTASFAVNYADVAAGRFDAFIAFVKDVFPEFAGALIVREAGGIFQTLDGRESILPTDRVFIGWQKQFVDNLTGFVKVLLNDGDPALKKLMGQSV